MSDVKTITVTVNKNGDIILGSGIIIGKLTHAVVYDFLMDESTLDLTAIVDLPKTDRFYLHVGNDVYWYYCKGTWQAIAIHGTPDVEITDVSMSIRNNPQVVFRDYNLNTWKLTIDKDPVKVALTNLN